MNRKKVGSANYVKTRLFVQQLNRYTCGVLKESVERVNNPEVLFCLFTILHDDLILLGWVRSWTIYMSQMKHQHSQLQSRMWDHCRCQQLSLSCLEFLYHVTIFFTLLSILPCTSDVLRLDFVSLINIFSFLLFVSCNCSCGILVTQFHCKFSRHDSRTCASTIYTTIFFFKNHVFQTQFFGSQDFQT